MPCLDWRLKIRADFDADKKSELVASVHRYVASSTMYGGRPGIDWSPFPKYKLTRSPDTAG